MKFYDVIKEEFVSSNINVEFYVNEEMKDFRLAKKAKDLLRK